MRAILVLVVFLVSLLAVGQVRIQNLYFNSTENILRLNFGNQSPTPVYTGIDSGEEVGEGIAHVEDTEGNTIIWVNASGVYDKNGTLMPGSAGILAHPSSTEIVLCPFPDQSGRFYVFYNSQLCSALYYAVVDMKQRGGLGDVVSKNTRLDVANVFAEGLEIIRIPCTNNYWLMTYQCGTGFKRFRIKDTGVDAVGTLVESFTFTVSGTEPGRGELDYHAGRIGYTDSYGDQAFVANFDPVTGAVSNRKSLSLASEGIYGVEFSPDGTKAYFTNWYNVDFFGDISGPNLYSYDFATQTTKSWILPIGVTNYPDANVEGLGQLELGKDGNLYTPFVNGKQILVVGNPNTSTPTFSTIDVDSVLSTGVSDHIQSDFLQPITLIASKTTICPDETVSLTVQGGSGTYRWSPNIGTTGNLQVQPKTTTTYKVFANNAYGCADSAAVTIHVNNTNPTLATVPEPVGCRLTSQLLKATSEVGIFQWYRDGQLIAFRNSDTLRASESGIYQVRTQLNGCVTESNVVTVTLAPPQELFVPNIFTPDNDPLHLNETFEIRGYSGTIRLTICDRWGKQLFHSDNYQNDWRAENLPPGPYYYYLTHANNCFKPVKGWVHVLRGNL